MATEIEQTIYKLSIDDSEYISGVDSASASTKKLSTAQQEANNKLNQLKETSRLLKEEIKGYSKELKENEKQVSSASAKLTLLNSLSKQNKDAVKAASDELSKYTKIQQDLQSKISASSISLNSNNDAIGKQKKVLKDAEKASNEFSAGLSKVYGGLNRFAALIPGLGLGGLIALLSGPLVNAFKEWIANANSAGRITKDITDAAIKGYTSEVTHLSLIKDKLLDLTIPQQKRIALAKDYNKTAEEGNKIDLKQINNIDLINAAIDRQIEKIKQRALARAAENVITQKAEKLFLAQAEFDSRFPGLTAKNEEQILKNAQSTIDNIQKTQRLGSKANIKELIAFADLPEDVLKDAASKNSRLKVLFDDRARSIVNAAGREVKAINEYKKGLRAGGEGASIYTAAIDEAQKDLDTALKAAKPFITIDGLFSNTKIAAIKKGVENIYIQELQKLIADIAKLDEKGFTNEASITKGIEEDFKKREIAFDKAFKNKQLTAKQLASLKTNLDNLQKLTLEANLKSFREQRQSYLQQINDEIVSLQNEEAIKRISTIQDSFERERQTIISETDKTVTALSQRRDKLIADITKNAAKNGLTASDIKPQIEQIKNTYGDLLDDLQVIKLQKLQQLSFETFEKLSEDAKRLLDSGNLGVSEGSLINIKAQTKLFLDGKISYEKYQKELTDIARFEVQERFRLQKLFLEAEIKVREDKLKSDKALTADQVKRLQDEILRLKQQLTDAEKGNELTTSGTDKAEKDEKINTIVRYAQALGNLVESVVGFWAKMNEAESKALDRSITLQEKRVEAAQRIAARGNAEYLQAEEDRLNELQVKRENAARKQLGVNAVLQGSEIIVALISGLAQGAKIGGPLGAVAGLAAIAAAIAGAFAIAESLKPEPPSFFVGTKDTGRGGNKDSKGGFDAKLHPHEAIIPEDRNKAYHPAVAAIYDRTIPPEHLNEFVKNYHRIKPVAQPNYQRIKEVAELSIGQDGRMSVLLNENNRKLDEHIDLQRQTLRAMKSMSINASIDKNGVAIAVNEYISQMKIDKKI